MPAFFRLIALVGVVSLPLVAAGAAVWDLRGAGLGLLLTAGWLLSVASKAEELVLRELSGNTGIPDGLSRTFSLMIRDLRYGSGATEGAALPELAVYPDPLPNAVVVRSLGKPGLILLSEGLLRNGEEKELRAILRYGVLRSAAPDWVFTSLCAVLAAKVFRKVPQEWARLFYSGRESGAHQASHLEPGGFLLFSIFFPLLQLLLRSGGKGLALTAKLLEAGAKASGRPQNPGLAVLHLFDPTSAEQLIPSR